MNSKVVHMVAFLLLIVGGLNWLLTAFGYNVVELIFKDSIITQAIYVLVGLSAVYEVLTHKKHCSTCGAGSSSMSAGSGM